MAYVSSFYRVTPIFAVNGTDERAVFDLSVAGVVGDVLPDPDLATAEDLAGRVISLYAAIAAHGASWGRFLGLKLALVGTDGSYLAEPVTYSDPAPTSTGTNNAVIPQNTIVCSLLSGDTLGKGNYGRVYLPYTGKQNGSDYQLQPAEAQTIATAFADFIGDVNGLFGAVVPTRRVRIMSQAGSGPGNKPVVEVRVDTIVDTQRRRRNQLTGVRRSSAV